LLVEGHKVSYMKDVPIKVLKENTNESYIETLKIKLLVLVYNLIYNIINRVMKVIQIKLEWKLR